MRTTLSFAILAVSLVFTPLALAQDEADDPLDITGTYRFVERELPDGTIVSKGVAGMLTFTDEYRNFNVQWTDEEGRPASISIVSTYELTADEYTETNIYAVTAGAAVEGGVHYDLEPESGTSAVTVEGGSVAFDLPLWEEPHLVFEGDQLTATAEGEFVDRWEKVD